MLGYRSDANALLAAADLFVHLPRHEGFGLVLLEAVAAGTPIVASNVGGIPEVLARTPYRPVSLADHAAIRRSVQHWLEMPPGEKEYLCGNACSILPFYSDGRRATEVARLLADVVRPKRSR
jgi:glycosyltransferase involved in cell wall biosynthesis